MRPGIGRFGGRRFGTTVTNAKALLANMVRRTGRAASSTVFGGVLEVETVFPAESFASVTYALAALAIAFARAGVSTFATMLFVESEVDTGPIAHRAIGILGVDTGPTSALSSNGALAVTFPTVIVIAEGIVDASVGANHGTAALAFAV